MIVGIYGMGLIGGSFCRALKRYTDHTVLGMTRSMATVEFARSIGAIDGPLTDWAATDICLVALPPEATVSFLRSHVHQFRPGSIVLDICGVKAPVLAEVDELYASRGVRFVGSHPMAGREVAGFGNSDADLYRGASMIFTPTVHTDRAALDTLTQLMRQIGFGRIVETTPEHHDAVIAYTSQLAHVVSSAYIKSPTAEQVVGFSAGSFQDMTRVARLDPEMWATLFLANRQPLLTEIDTLMEHLQQFRTALEKGDRAEMVAQLQRGRALREQVLLRQHQAAAPGEPEGNCR